MEYGLAYNSLITFRILCALSSQSGYWCPTLLVYLVYLVDLQYPLTLVTTTIFLGVATVVKPDEGRVDFTQYLRGVEPKIGCANEGGWTGKFG
jgi:hypothetical protein